MSIRTHLHLVSPSAQAAPSDALARAAALFWRFMAEVRRRCGPPPAPKLVRKALLATRTGFTFSGVLLEYEQTHATLVECGMAAPGEVEFTPITGQIVVMADNINYVQAL